MKKHKTEEPMDTIITYKCPACDAELKYSGASEKMTCEYCGSTFDAESVKAYNETLSAKQEAPDFVRKILRILLSSSVFNDCPAFATKQSASPL